MIAFPNQFNDTAMEIPDPLSHSESDSLPFPSDAAQTLANLRSERYDHCDLAIEEAEMRIREFASMMGLSSLHSDPPDAA